MKKQTVFILLALVSLLAFAGKPLYSGRYNVIQNEGKGYSIQVEIYKTYIMVGKQRCAYTN